MRRGLVSPIILGVFTVLAILLLTAGSGKDDLGQTFEIDATYYPAGHVDIRFLDKSGKTDYVVVEILGMEETFHESVSGSEFGLVVEFPVEPKHGWKVHPVVLDIAHPELGPVQAKTEIRPQGDPAPPVIYSRP